MGTTALACPGVRANMMIARVIGAGLTPPPPFATITDPTPLGAVPE